MPKKDKKELMAEANLLSMGIADSLTAADAGMLDVAKAAIDTATAFVQWTSESQNLVPVLTSVAGVLITIKAQKIADEFISIGGAFKNAGNARQKRPPYNNMTP